MFKIAFNETFGKQREVPKEEVQEVILNMTNSFFIAVFAVQDYSIHSFIIQNSLSLFFLSTFLFNKIYYLSPPENLFQKMSSVCARRLTCCPPTRPPARPLARPTNCPRSVHCAVCARHRRQERSGQILDRGGQGRNRR